MKKTGWASFFFSVGLFLVAWGCHPSGKESRAQGTLAPPGSGSAIRASTRNPSLAAVSSSGATPTACEPNPRFAADGSLLPTPTLPPNARIDKIHGHSQTLPLDCESRSAVDWADYFSVEINELEFFNKIPASDNPDKGFVGSVYGSWGNLPPKAYGVHAGPVAFLLRYYGLEAYAYRGMSWEQLRAELATGRPVLVWVVGHVWRSTPVTMTVASGDTILAARLEHTIILIGYTEKMATVLDGAAKYSVEISAFMASWNTLGNMAIVGRILPARPDCAGRAVELVP
jgi:uncharacterized protein YvpB